MIWYILVTGITKNTKLQFGFFDTILCLTFTHFLTTDVILDSVELYTRLLNVYSLLTNL